MAADPSVESSASNVLSTESPDLAERRQLTVQFSDLVGSTSISEQLDPEDYRALIARYRNTVSGLVEKYGGQVANFVGDGVVALFGYPVVHEDSTYAAALSALEIADAVPCVADAFPHLALTVSVRVGLHTGSVVVGESVTGSHSEKFAMFGETPNIAARIQSHAGPGQVVVSATTHRLIGPQLTFESLGRPTLPGVRQPTELFRVRRPKRPSASKRRDVSSPAESMIGRRPEIALVETRWEAAKDGDGQVLLITGEAGIGKSRIVFSLGQNLSEGDANHLTLFGSPLHTSSAFYPVRSALISAIGLAESDTHQAGREKLEFFLGQKGVDPTTYGPSLGRLLGFDDTLAEAGGASPEREKAAILSGLLRLCARLAQERPLLMVLDDVHWIDPSTLDFISRWIGAMPGHRCLLLVTARPEFTSPWKNFPHATALELNRLGRRDTIALIERIAGVKPAETVLDQIVARTDGVPLFIEELTKMIAEVGILTGAESFRGDLSVAIPESLQDSLMARLDRLASVKEVAQIASAIGRTFSYEVLSRVRDRDDVSAALAQLVEADVIVPTNRIGKDPAYRFRHALLQDAAYQSMLRTARTRWHALIAAVLEQEFPGTEPEVLGHHYLFAGNHAAAEAHWVAAGRMASARSANVEAIQHFGQALDCLRETPASEARDRRELDLQVMIAVPLAFVNGYAHPSVRAAYSRARDLCRQYGEMERLFKVIYGQLRSSMLGGEYVTALENAELLVSLSEEISEPMAMVATERSNGSVLTYLGRPEEAIVHLERGIAVGLTLEQRVAGLDFDVVDLAVALRGYLGLSNWLCGHSGEALAAAARALELSRESDHPFSISFAVAFAGWVYQFTGDEEAVKTSSAHLIALSEENNFQFWIGWGRVMNGWARRAELGEKALSTIEQGLAEWRDTGSRLGLSYFLYLYAETALSIGKIDRAEEIVAEAEAFEEESGERFWSPELIRLKGELASARGDEAEAMERFREAVAAARDMGLRGPLLRTATTLARRAPVGPSQLEAAQILTAALSDLPEADPAVAAAQDLLGSLPCDNVAPEFDDAESCRVEPGRRAVKPHTSAPLNGTNPGKDHG